MTVQLWVVCGVAISMILAARVTIYRRRYTHISDVATFARRLVIDDFERITDPAEEWRLRTLARSDFRELVRQRMRLCAEYLARVAHNAEVVQGWSNHEYFESLSRLRNPADEKTYLLWEIAKTATEIRLFALMMRVEVGFALVLRLDLLPLSLVPRIYKIRTVAGVDLLGTYKTMIDLVKQVSQFYGPEWPEKLNAAL